MSYQTLIDALEAHGCKVNLTSGMAQCPAHDDRDPSLAVTERAGTVLIKCHAGCDTDRVLDALNLTWPEVLADSMPGSANERPRRSATGRARQTDYGECLMPIPGDAPRAPDRLLLRDGIMPSRSWKYRDAAGQVLYGVLRWDLSAGKEIRPLSYWRREGMSGWRLALPPAPRPIYGLDRLAARPISPVLVVEGEKAADAASLIFSDHVCVCWSGGASALKQIDWTPLAGRRCVLWPDADSPGIAAMRRLAGILGSPARVLDLSPDLPQGWDLADDPPAGFDPLAMLAPSAFADDFDYRMLLAEVLRFSSRYAGLVAQPGLTVACVRDARQAWLATAKLSPEIWCRTYAVVGVEY